MVLKILLKYKYFILMIITIILSYFITNIKRTSKYDINETLIKGYIHNYKIDGNKLTIEVIGKEKIIGNYYFKEKADVDNFNLKFGDYIEIKCTLIEPKDSTLFNGFSYKSYLKENNIYLIMKIENINKLRSNNKIRYHIKNFIINRIESIPLSKKYLYAFIIGEEYYINSNIKKSYQIIGISHLLAVSGSNITFVIAIFLKFINKFKYKYIIIFGYVFLYMFLTDFTASIIRSGVFFILVTLNKIYKKNINIKDILYLTLIFSLIYNPYLIYSVGYQFSFVISLYLILFQNLIKKFDSYIGSSLIVTLIAFLSSLPIVLNNFYEINLLSILFNLIYVPFVSFILFPFSLITFILPIFDKFLYPLTLLLEKTSLFLSKINTFKVIIGKPSLILIILYYIAITLILFKPKYTYFLIILLIINKLNYYSIYPYVEFIDVGQGDSSLIKYKNKSILIDTGGIMKYKSDFVRVNDFDIGDDLLLPYLKSKGISNIHYLIITHGDFDHIGGSYGIVNNLKVNKVIFNNDDYNKLELDLIKVLENKKIPYYQNIDYINMDKYKLYFINNNIYDNENDNSIVIYTEINNLKFLFMGDAGIDTEKDLIKDYDLSNIDVLKVGHHGSKHSTSKDFVDTIKPKYSIISVGSNNRFGHPTDIVLDNLKESKIYRTDKDGSIGIKLNKGEYNIKTCTKTCSH